MRAGRQNSSVAGFLVAVLVALSSLPSALGDDTAAVKSLSEVVGESESHLRQMNDIVKQAFADLERARQESDVARVRCVNTALTAMKGLLKLSEQNMLSLREAVANQDREAAEHEAMKISIANDKFVQLNSQVRSCGGPDMEGKVDGRPDIELVLDSGLPTADPVEAFKDVEVLTERPQSASLFR